MNNTIIIGNGTHIINSKISNGTVIDGSIFINGVEVPPPHENSRNITSITTVNNKIYVDGYEWKDGKWKRTIAALWHLWF